MFSPNSLLQFLIMFFISGTVITNGVLIYTEKDNFDFNTLSKNQKLYSISLISCEIYLGIILLYFIFYYLYYFSLRCYSDNPIVHNFNIWYFLFILYGLVIHIFILYHLFFNKDYIDLNIQYISIIFSSNISIILFLIFIINIYKRCYSNKKKYEQF
jgi:hypothetical protein